MAAFYYVRIVKLMYFDEAAEPFDRPIGREMSLILTVSGLLITFFFVWPSPVMMHVEEAANALFAG